MTRLSDTIIASSLSNFMTETRERFAQEDSTYIHQGKIVQEAEKKYEGLELPKEKKEIIEEYIDQIRILEQQYSDISYMSGMKDIFVILNSLGLLKID